MDAGNCGDNAQPHLDTAHIAQMRNINCVQESEIWNITSPLLFLLAFTNQDFGDRNSNFLHV